MYRNNFSLSALVHGTILLLLGGTMQGQPAGETSPADDSVSIVDQVAGQTSLLLQGIEDHLKGVEGKDLDILPFENPAEGLKGRIPGVVVSSYLGNPGMDPSVQIRGLNTYLFNHDPVILLDGTPITRMSEINFNDVASVEIVKDLATASLFGSNGANGVVLITTRTGNPGRNSMKFSANYGIESQAKRYELLNGSQSFSYMQELNQPLSGTPGDKSVYLGNYWSSGKMINTGDLRNNDQQDALFRSAARQDYSLSFSGGTDKTTFLVNGSYYYREGIVNPADFSRFTFSFNSAAVFTIPIPGSGSRIPQVPPWKAMSSSRHLQVPRFSPLKTIRPSSTSIPCARKLIIPWRT
jgi:TonB-dependent SusC/RagA subfamily outer membrane receptor